MRLEGVKTVFIIIEITFFITGLLALITGKIPEGLLRQLFGKGDFTLSPRDARIFGGLLVSPIPLTLIVQSLLAFSRIDMISGYSGVIEFFIVIIVGIAASIFVRSTGKNGFTQNDSSMNTYPVVEKKEKSLGLRLLMVLGIILLIFVIINTFTMEILQIGSTISDVLSKRGNVLNDFAYLGFNTLLFGLAIFGTYKLAKALRN
jgi:hypothetical protein